MRIVIVGAGIGGMATAALLAQRGHDVHVYEQLSRPGGRADKKVVDGFTFDTGPSWYLMPEVFDRFYRSLGTDAASELDIIRLDPSYKVFYEADDPIVITGRLERDAQTFEAIEPGAGKQLERYAAQSKKLYDLALQYFLYVSFNRPQDYLRAGILLRLPHMIRLMTTPIHRFVSRFVSSRRLQQILEYPMVFLGTSPFEAPALYSLMGALDFGSGVFYPRGGIYTIIESIEKIAVKAGVTFHYDSPVTSIVTTGGRTTGIMLENGDEIQADVVVSNADIHFTETTLLASDARSYREAYWQNREPSSSALLMYLGVRGPIPEFEHHNLLFVDTWKENFDSLYRSKTMPDKASLYISKTSATDPGVAPDGHETVFVLVPLPAGMSVDTNKLQPMADHYITQIERMTRTQLSSRIVTCQLFGPNDFGSQFHSWQNSMLGPSHVLRQSAFWRTSNRSNRVSNLYYVGAGTTPGIGLPMCLISAQNVVDRIVREQT